MGTQRMTMAQALVAFLKQQFVSRDGKEQRFFGGCFGIFGHGNVAGVGQALQQIPEFRYYQSRNEQAMVHAAAAYAKASNRLRTLACTTSIGPGATNMLTAAAGATINRLPVLLLPGDIFAHRRVAPVLQQLESEHTQDLSVNDCFKPVSRYWDRLYLPEQLISALPEAMRVLTSPSETGAVTLCLPQDVQAQAFDYPQALFEKRVWTIQRPSPDRDLFQRALDWIQDAKRPLIIAGGGVHYSEACSALQALVEHTGIPVAETQAGKGALPYDHPQLLGAMGVTGTPGANRVAREADLVIGVGTRYSDFTTASKTAFQHPDVRFVNLNVAGLDAGKHSALPLVADARVGLEMLGQALKAYQVDSEYQALCGRYHDEWEHEVDRIYQQGSGPLPSQGQIIGALNAFTAPEDVVLCAAGSLPGDLHKLWRTQTPGGYHLEYGYSCMGYEIAGGLGVKMAAPNREVYVMVGDGSYLMMAQELVTAIQEGIKLTVILIDNHGFASIGALSESLGSGGFGTNYRFRGRDGQLSGEALPLDFVANAKSLGAHAVKVANLESFTGALSEAKQQSQTSVIVVETDRTQRVGGYESWWDVAVAEVSQMETVQRARAQYEQDVKKERYFL